MGLIIVCVKEKEENRLINQVSIPHIGGEIHELQFGYAVALAENR